MNEKALEGAEEDVREGGDVFWFSGEEVEIGIGHFAWFLSLKFSFSFFFFSVPIQDMDRKM